jgi:hypothetical protein
MNMATWFSVKRLVSLAIATLILAGATNTSTARASDPYCPPGYVLKKVTSYETVVSYETRTEAYKVCVTKYDYYGQPYQTYEVRYRTVQVPVKKQVAVVKYVRVPVY